MASTKGIDALYGSSAVIDLSDPPLGDDRDSNDPLASLSALGDALDSYHTDVPAFINSILAPQLPPPLPGSQPSIPPDLVPIDKQLNELLTRLSLLSQDTSSALEQSIHDISRTVPRLTYDLQFMRESAISLQSSLQLVQDRVARQTAAMSTANGAGSQTETDEARTHRALEKLAHLDKLKTRMESARDILREAESWSTLESEITSFIAELSWLKAGERLAEASKSLVVFQSAEGEYESKRSLLISLQNELENALGAALREAIANIDTSACASFHEIFQMMDRGQEFQNYYFAARRAPIIDEWNKVVLLDAGTESVPGDEPSLKFTAFLPRFFSTVLSTLTSERTQIPLIFPTASASSILTSFLQTTLDGLSPSFQSRLSAVAEHYGAEALPEVIRAFKTTEELGVAVQSVMDKLAFNTQGGHASGSSTLSPTLGSPGSPGTQRTPRTPASNRMSISHRFSRSNGNETPSSPTVWETTLYEPFLDLQSAYPALEKRYLCHQLKNDSALTARPNKDDPARALWERAVVVFGMAEDAIGRCLSFTHGYGARGLIDALNEFIQAFFAENSGVLDSARSASRRATAPDELDFEGLDYSTEDWGAFQLGLHVLETCRGIWDRLSAFEGRLYFALAGVGPTLSISSADPSTFFHTDTTRGAITLLQQSTLNSIELHALASSLAPPAYPLIPAREAISSFTRSAQVFLQSIILSPLQAQLESYPSLPVWSQPDKAPRKGELQIPSFSLSPTDTIARVSEGLLNLLRVFEVYAADDALAFSIETLPFVDVDSLRELLHPPKPTVADKTDPGTPPVAPQTLTAEIVLSTWVSSLALSLLSHLTRSTLPAIKTLSTAGAAQLTSDLAYLSNAVRALDVEWDDLERWREAAECKDDVEWRTKAGDEVGKGVWALVGRLRGWPA